jgi:hypothetical protein
MSNSLFIMMKWNALTENISQSLDEHLRKPFRTRRMGQSVVRPSCVASKLLVLAMGVIDTKLYQRICYKLFQRTCILFYAHPFHLIMINSEFDIRHAFFTAA